MSELNVGVSVSLPRTIVERIDTERGDVSRSRFVSKLLERAYRGEQ